ncbi:BZ3500_MvSof-1268-A1-R1_Chr1-3g01715 [Microbotryum saponariae]|uniref:BZ3500_MvSof-1268-A1-R1_Chr1-3g01715 protein n=1 Tax=Microbotryum saponariae TaxID=289078 RepID=A0A2X0M729_9BASI|nr:BZ3500_MvSof-1268-A1-R1_Chr1-3g01715 [Microbotryum saponariae]SCZ94411.1 BZ3501_MvSof-1269-A2-R1_Chr1-3g01316 [Microbotryum saponariae]
MAPHPLANALLDMGVNFVVPRLKRMVNKPANENRPRPTPPPATPPAAGPCPPNHQDAGTPPSVDCLNNGGQQSSGMLKCGTKWQATGLLHCGNLTRGDQRVNIKECYTGRLGPAGTHGGSNNSRQRIEFLSWPPSEPGQVHLYQWSYHLEAFDYDYPSSGAFFTLMQLLTRDHQGALPPAIFRLELVGREVRAQCHYGTPPGQPRTKWAVPLQEFEGKTMDHVLEVKYGEGGYIHCECSALQITLFTLQEQVSTHCSRHYYLDRITDIETGKVVIEFNLDGINVAAKASVKCGMYRNKVCGPAAFAIGDFKFKRVA